MSSHISRRDFLARAATIMAAMPRVAPGSHGASDPLSLRIGVANLGSSPQDGHEMGLTLGVEEATHAAEMFGGSIELVPIADKNFPGALSAVVGDSDYARCVALARAADAAGLPFLNVASSADALRGAGCRRTMFHVAPSDAMYRDARSAANVEGQSLAWHPSLVRFGADTLNKRFLARFNRPMTSEAWTAWLGVKILWESSLRARSAEPAQLMDYLTRDTTQFDGHKGVPLSFRPWDRQLRQPLYVSADSRVIEVPSDTSREGSRDLLDRLGVRKSDTSCRIAS